mmetsp:Transcript_11728/g.29914  ORF Transcript_11728/g.29914 Transcript_11728/m.29914 type:complete len:96 (-) Transcript_11728:631-918(-)
MHCIYLFVCLAKVIGMVRSLHIARHGEESALRRVLAFFDSLMKRMPTTIEEDLLMLQNLGGAADTPMHLAIQYRVQRKKLIAECVDDLKAAMSML